MNNRRLNLSIFILLSATLAVYTFHGLSVHAKTYGTKTAGSPIAAMVSPAGRTGVVAKADDDDDDDDFEFRGVIQTLPNTPGFIGDWMVSGRTVHVSAATEIEHDNGQVVVGATVEVEGSLQTDGSVKAKQIEVKQAAGAGSNFSFTGTVEDLPNTMGRIGDW